MAKRPRFVYSKYIENPGCDEFVHKLEAHEEITNLKVLRMLPVKEPLYLQINARHRTEEALKSSEEHYITVTSESGVSIWDCYVEKDDYYV